MTNNWGVIVIAVIAGILVSVWVPGIYGVLTAVVLGISLGWASRFFGNRSDT